MAVTDAEKAHLDRLRQEQAGQTGLEDLNKMTQNIDLQGISQADLKSLVEPNYTGIDYASIDYANLDTDMMNTEYPGSIDIIKLRLKVSNVSLLKARTGDIIDTQSGIMNVTSEIRVNVDLEDDVSAKVISLGTNMQLINDAEEIRAEQVADKEIKSAFIEEV